jgi:molecular chaperone DnaK
VFTKLIERNTTIPTSKSQIFSTAADNQTTVEIHVLQGERQMAAGNKTLGRFQLTGIPPAPRGIPQIEVKFDIDANGIVHVSAKDMATGNEQKITITASSGLSDQDIDRMVKDAEAHAADDEKRKEEVEARNQADSLVYQAEKTIKDFGDKADKTLVDKVRKAVDDLREALKGTDVEVIKAKAEAVTTPLYELTTAMYQQQGAAGAQGAPGAGAGDAGQPKDDVVDAEYKVVDEDK